MAIPVTPNTSYVGGSTPTIKAADLNDLQEYTCHAFQGTKTLKSATIDGVSDNAGSAQNGALRLTATFSGTGGGAGNPSLPLTTVAAGELVRPCAPVGWAVINAAGTLLRGVNITGDIANVDGTFKTAAGVYTFTMGCQPSDTTNAAVLVTPFNTSRTWAAACNGFGGFLQVTVTLTDLGGVATDTAFQVVVFAE